VVVNRCSCRRQCPIGGDHSLIAGRITSVTRFSKFMGWLGPERSLAGRVALFSSAAVVGPSFEPGLQPRGTGHQAIATGVLAAFTLTSVSATQSAITAIGRGLGVERLGGPGSRAAFQAATNLGVSVLARATARALPPHIKEPARRGLLRTVADQTADVALAGGAISAAIGVIDAIGGRHPKVTRVPLALPAGVALSALHIHRVRRRAEEVGDTTISDVSIRSSIGMSLGVGAGIGTLQLAEAGLARVVSNVVDRYVPLLNRISIPIGHLVALGALSATAYVGYEYVTRRVEQGGSAIEPAYQDPPTSPCVSGGPGSLLNFADLSREGRRFVNMALTRAEIAAVMGEPARNDPARVFVGIQSAPDLDTRVELLMAELERTGAFDRELLVYASPTGSGYINYVFAEAVEYLTGGDSTIATMQYSMLPSSLSLTRTGVGIEQNRAAIAAIARRLDSLTHPPKFVLFGESLGAQTLLDVWRVARIPAMERDHVQASIFLGPPSATALAKAWRAEPQVVDPDGHVIEIDHISEWTAARHVMVTHHDDPIPKFGIHLLMREPDWLGANRPPGVPRSTTWRPTTTFILTGVDMLNAMEVIPGVFGRRGHDYREDLPQLVSQVYELPCSSEQMTNMEAALRARERHWAQRRVVLEQVARARESVLRELRQWSISGIESDDALLEQAWQDAS
jgi:uncharacterized membrane protein